MIRALAERLGRGELLHADARAVFDELRPGECRRRRRLRRHQLRAHRRRNEASSGPAPRRSTRARRACSSTASPPRRPRPLPRRSSTAAGRGADDEYPLCLTTGRVLAQYQSGTQTRRVPALTAADPEPFVEIHPEMARGTSASRDGDSGAPRDPARRGGAARRGWCRTIRLDTLFVPFHWGGRARQPADQCRARPGLADAGVQGLRGPRRDAMSAQAPSRDDNGIDHGDQRPRFLNGVYHFEGRGLATPAAARAGLDLHGAGRQADAADLSAGRAIPRTSWSTWC